MRSLHLIIAAASCVLAKPLEFDDLKPEKESLPYDVLTRDLLLNHKPFLEVDNSCDPAVAVSGNGETNSGINPDDYTNLDICKDPRSKGQVYARTDTYNDMLAIMYAWYFPMAKAPDTYSTKSRRHDWQQIILWLRHTGTGSLASDYTSDSISYSGSAGYTRLPDPIYQNGTVRPLVRYEMNDDGSHGLVRTYTQGLEQDLVEWSRFTQKAKDSSNHARTWSTGFWDFSGTMPPFSDRKFGGHLEAAWNGR